MNWFEWFFVISIVVFVLGSIITGSIIIYKLRQRKSVQAVIFLKSGGLTKFWFNRDKKIEKTVNGQAYRMDENAIMKTRYRDYVYFMEDNPNPIIFDFKNNKPLLNATELKTILDDDLLTKLFNQGELKTMQLLVIITLCCGVITMIGVLYLCFGSFKVKDTPELRQLIYNVTRSAIMGVPV